MAKEIRALILGDIYGQPGCRAVFIGLKQLIKETKADLVIANGENAADGFGITPEAASQLFSLGIDVITSGNHIWEKREIFPMLSSEQAILRPANYPPGAAGRGSIIIDVKGTAIAVLNLQGRRSLGDLDCPFRIGNEIIRKLREKAKIIIVDFHAESVEEKESLGYYLDGSVSAVTGTHTHVQTADERILPGGTGYISDIGMTGPSESVIGCDKDVSIQRALTQIPFKMEVAQSSAVIHGVVLSIDSDTGKCSSIDRIKKISFV